MSHSFHVSLSTILKKVPQLRNDHYHFYLASQYRDLQRKIEALTEDMMLVTLRCGTDTRTVLMEYTGDGFDAEAHEKALELVRGNFIFLYQHGNPTITAKKSMTRFLDHPDTCNQIYLYIEDGKKQNGNGYLLIAPVGENMIYPALLPVGEPQPPDSVYFMTFTRPTRRRIYIDLKPLGNKASQIKLKESILFSMPQKPEPYFCRNLSDLLKEEVKKNGILKVTEKQCVIQIPLNIAEEPYLMWQAYANEMPYVTETQIVETAQQREKTVTRMPSAEMRKITGEKSKKVPQTMVETPKERDFNLLNTIRYVAEPSHTSDVPIGQQTPRAVVTERSIQPGLPPGVDRQAVLETQQRVLRIFQQQREQH